MDKKMNEKAWSALTIDQVSVMLLQKRHQNDCWERLKKPLRDKNYNELQMKSRKKPLGLMTYALTQISVWYALSRGEFSNKITLEYLKKTYHFEELFWDYETKEKSQANGKGYYMYEEYLSHFWAGSTDSAEKCLSEIKNKYQQKPFDAAMPLETLLKQCDKDPNVSSFESLKEVLDNERILVAEAGFSQKRKMFLDLAFSRNPAELIRKKVKLILFTGAPGTGKTYIAKRLAECLGAELPPDSPSTETNPQKPADSAKYKMVQFHPSYDYTDFVEGLRPVQGKDGKMQFVKMDGAFKAFCRRIAEGGKPGERYFFIIDEINRADLSKVFGEMMSLLEPDKRGPQNAVQTQYQNLDTYDKDGKKLTDLKADVFAEGFYIPENVYIIGTMNDIDRSVESMDFAMRRRFNILEVKADEDMLKEAFFRMKFHEKTAEELAGNVAALNQAILDNGERYGLNRQYFIAQGYFAGLPADLENAGAKEIRQYVWDCRLESLLREYLRGASVKDIDEFAENCRKAFKAEGAQ